MNGWPALDRFLRTDPRDVGCGEAMAMLHVYADLVAAGEPAGERDPGIAAHLHAGGPCGEDFDALLPPARDAAGGPVKVKTPACGPREARADVAAPPRVPEPT